VTEILTPVAMLAAGLGAGALVTLVARALPERGRLIDRPSCAAQGCALGWSAISQVLRKLGPARECPTCGAGPARSDVLLELATAGTFVALGLAWPPGAGLAVHAAFAALLMVILAIDLRHRQVYLVLGLGGVALALLAAPVSMSGSFVSAAVGGAIGAIGFGGLYLLGRAIYRGGEPLGTGDITIATLLGAIAGFPGVFTALMVGIFAGGAAAIALLAAGRSRKAFMPYGPALCLGGLWAMLTR
jgi:leader peptidase (prepilin peptidase)/N-methyltransferase